MNINQTIYYRKTFSTLVVKFRILLEIFNFIIKKEMFFMEYMTLI